METMRQVAAALVDNDVDELRNRCLAIFEELEQRGAFVVRTDLAFGDDAAGDYIARLFVFLSAARDYPNNLVRDEKAMNELSAATRCVFDSAMKNIEAMVTTIRNRIMPAGHA